MKIKTKQQARFTIGSYKPYKPQNLQMDNTSDVLARIDNVFTPSQPISVRELFAGRSKEIEKSMEAIVEKGGHLIIYGDRGVGKTSLANILRAIISTGMENNEINIYCTYKVCNSYESFEGLWEKTLNELKTSQKIENQKIGFPIENEETNEQRIEVGLGTILKNRTSGKIEISDICDFLKEINENFIFIFDEFDRLTSKEVKEKFSYMLKMLSDTNNKITIILVGIAQDIHEIIENHESVERCLKQVHIPRMPDKELKELIEKGETLAGIKFNDEIKNKIINFSEGFPQYIHLLCKYAANEATKRNSETIEEKDLKASVEKSIENIQETIKNKYRVAVKVIGNNKTNKFKPVLFACAFAKTDEYGYFTSKDVQHTLKIVGHEMTIKQYGYHLSQLCKEEKGEILEKLDTSSQYSYKFKNPLVKAYIKIKAYQEGIEEEI